MNMKSEQIMKLNQEIQKCEKCLALVESRKLYAYGKPTTGCGYVDSKVMFIGLCPGMYGCGETGVPFTRDRSGELFTRFLATIGLNHDTARITNLVKCCPKDNRVPEKNEIDNCKPFLERELRIINPKIIIPLGNEAMRYFYPDCNGIWIRAGVIDKKIDLFGTRYIMPTFHPAFICRRPDLEWMYEEHFQKIKEMLNNVINI